MVVGKMHVHTLGNVQGKPGTSGNTYMLCLFKATFCSCVSCTPLTTGFLPGFFGAKEGLVGVGEGFVGAGAGCEGLVGCWVLGALGLVGAGVGVGGCLGGAGVFGSSALGAVMGLGTEGCVGGVSGVIGTSLFGITSLLQSKPMTLPGGPYWQT